MSEQRNKFRGLLFNAEHWLELRRQLNECDRADKQRSKHLVSLISDCQDRMEHYFREYVLAVVREEAE
jgi:hypothetical protein